MALCAACVAYAVFIFAVPPRVLTIRPGDPPVANATTTQSTGVRVAGTATSAMPDVFVPSSSSTGTLLPLTPIDIAAYNAKLFALANLRVITTKSKVTSTLPTGVVTTTIIYTTSTVRSAWPVKTAPYPDAGAILPFKRIVAYYGNFYSTQMGVLGEYPVPQMLAMLASTTAMWAAADPATPVMPALDYIAVSAQASAGADGKYRARMPANQIEKAIALANQINGIVFLDIQVGLSSVETEVPLLGNFLKLPNVELSLDPEFAMHAGERPGTVIGTLDAANINFAAQYLANLVRQNNLPPKILVVHRFTEDMVTDYKNIAPSPEVQIVMDMDGFGNPAKKIGTYTNVIAPEPVQFTGFKLFYRNDAIASSSHLMPPAEVLKLSPQPSYIQYQ